MVNTLTFSMAIDIQREEVLLPNDRRSITTKTNVNRTNKPSTNAGHLHPCLDFDPPAFEIRREGAGVAPPVRAPGVVRKEARSESGDRFSRREFGRLGRVRSSRSWRTASSCNLAAGPVPFEALSYRGPDPCADVGLMLCPEPIQAGVQVRSEASWPSGCGSI